MRTLQTRNVFLSIAFVFICVITAGLEVSAQTCDVTWRKVDNPRVISGEVAIPAGQTVCVKAGVQVQFAADGN